MTICYLQDHQEKLKSEWVDTAGHSLFKGSEHVHSAIQWGWMVWRLNHGSDKTFLSPKCPDHFWAPTPSLQFNGYPGSFLGVKQQRHYVDHSSPSSATVTNKGFHDKDMGFACYLSLSNCIIK
jgi:hypothetical protein